MQLVLATETNKCDLNLICTADRADMRNRRTDRDRLADIKQTYLIRFHSNVDTWRECYRMFTEAHDKAVYSTTEKVSVNSAHSNSWFYTKKNDK